MSEWRDVFCGRAPELAQLIEAYDAVANGAGPRLVVVCADRGMGKTRLVQELYRHLSTAYDPDDYWPDASLFKGNNLRVAPDFGDPSTQAHYASFTTAQRPMPFLWWGFRLPDPLDRNAVRSDMAAHRRTLDPHLERACFAREHAARHAAVKRSATETAKDAALKIGEALLESVPVVGLGKNLIEVGAGLIKTVRAHSEAKREQETFNRADLAGLEARRVEDLYEGTLQDLAAVLQPNDGLGRVPVVVFCDDAQFAREGGDEGALCFLQQLWQRAEQEGWPLLLLATHWAVDWEQDPKSPASSFAKVFEPVAQRPAAAKVVMLSKPAELVDLVLCALPGMPAADTRLLVDKADGNPQVLIELVARVRASPAWRTQHGALSPHGRRQIDEHSCNLTTLITERLLSDATPPEVRVALALASVQGMQFLAGLTEAAARQLAVGEAVGGLVAAENPLRLVVGVQDGVASFVQRAYREAAAALVETQLGEPAEIRRGVLGAALQLVEPGEAWERLPVDQRKWLLGIVASLGVEAKEDTTRLQAARALLRLLEIDTDIASRAHHARALAQGTGKHWSATSFESHDIDAIAKALNDWDGLRASAWFEELCLLELRPAAASNLLVHGRRLIDALLRLADHRCWQDRREEAARLADEAIDTARSLRAVDPGFDAGALADVLKEASGNFDIDGSVRCETEELALRTQHFETRRDVQSCWKLVQALDLSVLLETGGVKRRAHAEAVAAARRLCTWTNDALASQCMLIIALAYEVEGLLNQSNEMTGVCQIQLLSAEAAADAIPAILELVERSSALRNSDEDEADFCSSIGSLLPETASRLAAISDTTPQIWVCIAGALAAHRCGDEVAGWRLLELSHSLEGDLDINELEEEERQHLLRWMVLRALLKQDLERATSLAHQALRCAIASRNWYWVESARSFLHRLEDKHLFVLVEPDPTDDDCEAVLPELIRDICERASAWANEPAEAEYAFRMIASTMRRTHERGQLAREPIDEIVRQVRLAFESCRNETDPAFHASEAALQWMSAIAYTLAVATRGGRGDDFEFLWDLLGDIAITDDHSEKSVGELEDFVRPLDMLRDAIAENGGTRTEPLDFALLTARRLIADRTNEPVDRALLADALGLCAFRCMRDNDDEQAVAMLDEAYTICTELVVQAESRNTLCTMRRNLEAREFLARRRGDTAAAREARLERRTVLQQLTRIDEEPRWQQELDELTAPESPGVASTTTLH